MGSDSARTSSRLANSPRSLSAGGHDEQPWLVNSSTTARGSAAAGIAKVSPATAAAAEKEASFAVKAHRSVCKVRRSILSVDSVDRSLPKLWATLRNCESRTLETFVKDW